MRPGKTKLQNSKEIAELSEMWLMPILVGSMIAIGYGVTKNLFFLSSSTNQSRNLTIEQKILDQNRNNLPQNKKHLKEKQKVSIINNLPTKKEKTTLSTNLSHEFPPNAKLVEPTTKNIIRSNTPQVIPPKKIKVGEDFYKDAELLFNAQNQIEIFKRIPER